ncbi:MAG: hypothetical protein NZ610_04930 [Candidatus Bipolaricaulota bacterium]|nr:hypothetical protein [Candidatus Bipolaricaulota bacterium]MCS7274732.1 hypothetical protein [Candidatus Bipolaricaulota bacterium]MDW8110011.1 R3H domain-containing nucleic acid-binding protein [Candidatus Bipolaricaulota bacterium]MDW8328917.1 R3H domain-containing nucleic acid-binding protein [Candidatus Bipolaricaulota bacterium]
MEAKIVEAIETFLRELFEIAGEPARWHLQEREDGLWIDLQGARVFVGENQSALRALAHILEIYLRRSLEMDLRIHVDADGYRERRQAELRALALKWAEEAVRERKTIVLDPMEAYERKAIHEALSQFPGARSRSEGSGEERRVVIEPV